MLLQVRDCVAQQAQHLEISPEILLEPRIQRALAWDYSQGEPMGPVDEYLTAYGARPWQVSIVAPDLHQLLAG